MNKSACCAIRKIKDNQYCSSLIEYSDTIGLSEIATTHRAKKLTCKIECFEKQ